MLITRFYFIEDEDEDFCVFSADWPKKGGGGINTYHLQLKYMKKTHTKVTFKSLQLL